MPITGDSNNDNIPDTRTNELGWKYFPELRPDTPVPEPVPSETEKKVEKFCWKCLANYGAGNGGNGKA